MGAYMPGDDDIDEAEVDTLGELYKLWQEAKAGDASCGEKEWKYRFYKHTIKGRKNARTESRYLPTTFARGKSTGGETRSFSNRRGREEAISDYQKGEQEYSVTELSHEWKAEQVLGGVTIEYKIPKEAAPDGGGRKRYIAENEIFLRSDTMPEAKRKTHTSTEVKRRYNEKTYTLISARRSKGNGGGFQGEMCSRGYSASADYQKKAIEDFLSQ